jgi:hypothetical protein
MKRPTETSADFSNPADAFKKKQKNIEVRSVLMLPKFYSSQYILRFAVTYGAVCCLHGFLQIWAMLYISFSYSILRFKILESFLYIAFYTNIIYKKFLPFVFFILVFVFTVLVLLWFSRHSFCACATVCHSCIQRECPSPP